MVMFSRSTLGFYPVGHPAIPTDAVEITAEDYAALLAGQSATKCIAPDSDGRPILADRPAPTQEQLAAAVRATRDAKLTACDWTQLADAPLSAEVKAAWSTYRQALRDITAQAGFPQDVTWPSEPGA